jgi:hypothetical protein
MPGGWNYSTRRRDWLAPKARGSIAFGLDLPASMAHAAYLLYPHHVEKHEPNMPKQGGIGTHRDARGRWLPGVKQAPCPGRGYVGEKTPQHSFAAYTDALREHVSPERWA